MHIYAKMCPGITNISRRCGKKLNKSTRETSSKNMGRVFIPELFVFPRITSDVVKSSCLITNDVSINVL